MKQDQLWRQYIVAGIANILATCFGFTIGWTAPIGPKLRSAATSPLDSIPNKDEIAWIGSLITLGGILGPFFGGPAASKLGRKWGLMSACIPMMLGWILVVVAVDITYLYAARILWGVAAGIIFTITPTYCAEIATNDTRGALGSFLQFFTTLGILLVYAIGPYTSYWGIGYIGIASVATFAVIFIFVPETPTYYLLKNDRETATSCLCTLRGRSRSAVEAELSKIEVDIKASFEKTATVMDIFRGSNFKALYISCALMLFQQLSGINAVIFYMTDIFKESGIDIDPALATIIIGVVQMCASLITPFVVDRLGRRLLLLVSSCGVAIALMQLGTFFLLVAKHSEVVANISFLPILSLVLFILTYCWGLGPLPWAVMSELFSIEVKAVATPIVTSFCWTIAFLVTRYFEPIAIALGRYVAFWIFAVFCVIAFFFTLYVVPETKGRSFQEIQDILAERKTSIPDKS